MAEIRIYTIPTCVLCAKAKGILAGQGYTEITEFSLSTMRLGRTSKLSPVKGQCYRFLSASTMWAVSPSWSSSSRTASSMRWWPADALRSLVCGGFRSAPTSPAYAEVRHHSTGRLRLWTIPIGSRRLASRCADFSSGTFSMRGQVAAPPSWSDRLHHRGRVRDGYRCRECPCRRTMVVSDRNSSTLTRTTSSRALTKSQHACMAILRGVPRATDAVFQTHMSVSQPLHSQLLRHLIGYWDMSTSPATSSSVAGRSLEVAFGHRNSLWARGSPLSR